MARLPSIRRNELSPSTLNGGSVFARTAAVVTRQISDSSSVLVNGVKGTQ